MIKTLPPVKAFAFRTTNRVAPPDSCRASQRLLIHTIRDMQKRPRNVRKIVTTGSTVMSEGLPDEECVTEVETTVDTDYRVPALPVVLVYR
jgi:hypothetical protein